MWTIRKIVRQTSTQSEISKRNLLEYQCQNFFLILLSWMIFHCPWRYYNQISGAQYNLSICSYFPVIILTLLFTKLNTHFINMFQNIVFVHCDQFSRHFLSNHCIVITSQWEWKKKCRNMTKYFVFVLDNFLVFNN